MPTKPLSSGHNDSASTRVVNEISDSAQMAEDAVRRLAHLTIARASMTPADLDTVLGHLAAAIAAVPQGAIQLGRILDRSGDTCQLSMDGMTATTDRDVAIAAARLHLDAVRDSALGTYRHLDSARNEVAHISVDAPVNASDALQRTQETPVPGGAGSRRHEDREPPSFLGPSREGTVR